MASGRTSAYHVSMTDPEREEVIRRHIAWCRKERAEAQEFIDLVEKGWRFDEGQGDAPMVDVTDKRVAHWREVIEKMTAIIGAYGDDDVD